MVTSNKLLLTFCLALMLLSSTALAQQAWTTVKEWDSGPSSDRLDVVIMGDGYTAAEMPLFRTHVTNFINEWFTTVPISRYKNHINIWRVEVISQQSGADKPSPCFTPAVLVNTELDAKYCTSGTKRCLTSNTSKVLSTALINVPNYDEVIVVVNDAEYGGCANSISTYTGVHNSSLLVAIHELGHSAFGLADEYETAGATYTGSELSQVNVSIHESVAMAAMQTKWHNWLGIENVGTFEGARYNEFGIYRPRSGCKMRSNGGTFCPVCREKHVADFWSYVTQYDAITPDPNAGVVTGGTTLSVDLPALGNGSYLAEWSVDGSFVSFGTQTTSGSRTTISLDPTTYIPAGTTPHAVTLKVIDDTTFYRIASPFEPLPPVTWTATGAVIDGELLSFTVKRGGEKIGDLLELEDSFRNNGPTIWQAGQKIRYYMSTDATITSSDIVVGERTLPQLNPLISPLSTATSWGRIPPDVAEGSYYFGAIADADEQVAESDESNNVRVHPTPFVVTANTTLSCDAFFMPLASPMTATLSLDFGANAANDNYLFFVSLASPATANLGIYHGAIDFSFDELTDAVFYKQFGPPIFQNFDGTLSPTGQTQAAFYKPAITGPLPPGLMYFIAIRWHLDPSLGVVIPEVSNRVQVYVF